MPDDSLDLLNDWLEEKRRHGKLTVPENAAPVCITLENPPQDFMREFLKGLYVLEQAMAEKGFDPSAFTLRKSRVRGNIPGAPSSSFTYDYTISFHDNEYSVRREGDMLFLAYFSNLCLSDEHEALEDKHAQTQSFFSKLVNWLEGDALPPYPEPH